MRVSVLGAGFGLYGYLPALCKLDHRVCTLLRYREKLCSRKELVAYDSQIDWVYEEADLFAAADGIVIAKPPFVQERYLNAILQGNRTEKRYFFEKPLAVTPQKAKYLLDQLVDSGYRFSVSYLFRYQPWYQLILAMLNAKVGDGEICITWQFMAHHFSHRVDTWKSDHGQGGGVVRFYAIHLIAVAAGLGYTYVEQVKVDDAYMRCVFIFQGEKRPPLRILVDSSCADTLFTISMKGVDVHTSVDPFGEKDSMEDYRIHSIISYIRDAVAKDQQADYSFQYAVLNLWEEAERISLTEKNYNAMGFIGN